MTKEEFATMMGVELLTALPPLCRKATSIFDFLNFDPCIPVCEPKFGMKYYIKGKFGWEVYRLHPQSKYKDIKQYEIWISGDT